jgi:hypothetical protein
MLYLEQRGQTLFSVTSNMMYISYIYYYTNLQVSIGLHSF